MKKIFIIAGEASGDYLGGKLIEDIKLLCNEKVEFSGVGGKCMENAGLKTIFSISELSIMGIWEVIGKVFHVKRLINKTVKAILLYKPDVVITIDSSGFTFRVNKKIKKLDSRLPIIHCVAPPVWAWREWRAKSMNKFIDKLLTLFPFESKIFDKHGLKTVFVGHPVTTDPNFDEPSHSEKDIFLKSIDIATENKKLNYDDRISVNICGGIADHSDVLEKKNNHENISSEKYKVITLLPGSRKSELNKHLPILSDFANLMTARYQDVKYIIPTIESLQVYIKNCVKNWNQKPIITADKYQKNLAYYTSDLAVAASGSVTLELARTGIPSIIIYKISAITAAIVKYLMTIKHVCLINILAKKMVVPELLQENCTAQNIFKHAKILLDNEDKRKYQKTHFKYVIDSLKVNDHQKAAKEVLSEIKWHRINENQL